MGMRLAGHPAFATTHALVQDTPGISKGLVIEYVQGITVYKVSSCMACMCRLMWMWANQHLS